MPLISINVPQADDLNKVLSVVKYKYQHGFISPSLLNLTKRQVDYYAHSARILGFLDRNLNLTQSGVNLATTTRPMQLMTLAFKNSDVYREWQSWALNSGGAMQGHANQFLTDYFSTSNLSRSQRLSDNQQGTGTISRRAKTLEDWYVRLC